MNGNIGNQENVQIPLNDNIIRFNYKCAYIGLFFIHHGSHSLRDTFIDEIKNVV